MAYSTCYIDRDDTVKVGEYRLWMLIEGYEPAIVASCPDPEPLQSRLDRIAAAKVAA